MERLRRLAGLVPAVIRPWATLDQLWTIVQAESTDGVSAFTWMLFLLANVGALCLGRAENRIAVVQMTLAFGLTALLDLGIVIAIVTRT